MNSFASRFLKTLVLGFGAMLLIGATFQTARADEVTVTGSTTFGLTAPGLTVTPSSFFTGTTSLGIGSLSGANSLATFFLNTGPQSVTGGLFQLTINFTSPIGIASGQSTAYQAIILGSISPNVDQGGVSVHWISPTEVFTFNDGFTAGSFSLTLADLFVQSGHSADLTAGIIGRQETLETTVPEPTTLLLLGTGVTGIAAKLRKRRKEKRTDKSVS